MDMLDKVVFKRDGVGKLDGWTATIEDVNRFSIRFYPHFPDGWHPLLLKRRLGDDFDLDGVLFDNIRAALFSEHESEMVIDNQDDIVVRLQ